MNVVLVYPPTADPCQPYSSLPALTAVLRQEDWGPVHQLDLNVELCQELLSRDGMERALQRVQERIKRIELGADGDLETYGRLVRAALTGPFVADEIDDALRELRSVDCYRDPQRLDRAKRSVFDGLQVLGGSNDFLAFDPRTAPRYRFGTVREIADAVEHPENPFLDFYGRALSRIRDLAPRMIGVSLTYHSQVVGAFTFAREVRRAMPQTKLVLGGQVVSQWHDSLTECPELFDWYDYLIAFEGETALQRLLVSIAENREPLSVPNLSWRDEATVRQNPLATEDINDLPTPDYTGLPLDNYLTPEPVFLLSSSRGCYWGRCAFCSVSPSFRGRHRSRDPDLVYQDIQTLVARHGARYLSFGDDCVAPHALCELAKRLVNGPDIHWQCEIRFEPGFTGDLLKQLRRAGCVNLIFGLESYSPRVQRSMSKGVKHSEIRRILDDCRRAEIAFNLQFFYGFPGETREEAEETTRFILEQAHGKATFAYGLFGLVKLSPIERDPQRYGVHSVDRERGPLAVSYGYAPAPAHAASARAALHDALQARSRYPHIGLSLTAQSLVHFTETTHTNLEDSYFTQPSEDCAPHVPRKPLEVHWRRPAHISVSSFSWLPPDFIDNPEPGPAGSPSEDEHLLAYDREQDRIIELSGLAFWLLERLDGSVMTAELTTELAAAAPSRSEQQEYGRTLAAVLSELASRGFLAPCDD